MNTRKELVDAFADYQRTGFGGRPCPRRNSCIHGKDLGSRYTRTDMSKVASSDISTTRNQPRS